MAILTLCSKHPTHTLTGWQDWCTGGHGYQTVGFSKPIYGSVLLDSILQQATTIKGWTIKMRIKLGA